MARVNVPGRTVAMLEAVGEILSAPQKKVTSLPQWLPDGTEAKTLGQVATLLRTDLLGASVYVLEAAQTGVKLDPGITAEAVQALKKPQPGNPPEGIKPPPASFKKGVAVMLPVPLSSSHFLWRDGGSPPEDLHITIAYYGTVDDEDFDFDEESMLDRMRDVASEFKPFQVTLNGLTRFTGNNPEVGDPLVVSCDSPVLDEIRASCVQIVGTPNMDHGFHPHITLGFVDPNDPTPGPARMEQIVIHIDTIVLGWEDKYYRVSLGDGEPLAEMKDVYHGDGPGGIPIYRTAGVPKKIRHRSEMIRRRLDDRKKRKKRKPFVRKLKELEQILEFKDERDYMDETKVVRRVRTRAGARRFGQPIGSIIVRDGARPLAGLRLQDSDYDGWDKIKGSNGKTYYVGQDEDEKGKMKWYATEGASWNKIVVTADSEEGALSALSSHVINRGQKPTPRSAAPLKPKKVPARGGIPQGVRKIKTEADYADEYDKYRDNNGASIYVTKEPDKSGQFIAYDKDDNEIGRGASLETAVSIAARRLGNHRHEMAPNKPREMKPGGNVPPAVGDAMVKIRNAASMHGSRFGEQMATTYEKLNNAYATDDPDARRSWLEGALRELIDAKQRAPKKDQRALQRWIDLFSEITYGKDGGSKPETDGWTTVGETVNIGDGKVPYTVVGYEERDDFGARTVIANPNGRQRTVYSTQLTKPIKEVPDTGEAIKPGDRIQISGGLNAAVWEVSRVYPDGSFDATSGGAGKYTPTGTTPTRNFKPDQVLRVGRIGDDGKTFGWSKFDPEKKPKGKKPTWDNMLGDIPPEGFTDADRVSKPEARPKTVHKTSKLAANEALHVWETQRDDGRDPGFEVLGNQVIVYDAELALSELSYQLDIHNDNADPATNPFPVERAKAKRRADAMRKLMDDIRQGGNPKA